MINKEMVIKKTITSSSFILICFFLLVGGPLSAQIKAFPGALGFGASVTGGREGTVYHVTTLADSGPGSFRDAVSQPNRIVVFDVSGYITLSSGVSVNSNITIAGQTAPGSGIGFKGDEISFANSHNIICRYIRIRPGSNSDETDVGLSFYDAHDIIVDHVSIEFAPWNDIDGVSDDWQNKPLKNITVQYSIIADPTGQQFGAHTESLDGTWSWFYNIFANSHNRNPLAKINTVFINNVLYNYQAGYTTHTSGHFKHDIINNYFIFGPATTSDNTWFQIDENQTMYYDGNLKDSLTDGILNGGITTPYWYHDTMGKILTAPWSSVANEVPIYSTQDAYHVVLSSAGTLPRDPVDSLVISQIKTLGKGTVGTGVGTAGPGGKLYVSQAETGLPNNGFGTIVSGEPAVDREEDGMPDYWETSVGLDPTQDDAMAKAADGYTNIEHYLHWLASPHAKVAENDTASIDLYRYTGGFIKKTPAYSLSDINHGQATIGSNGHVVKFVPDSAFVGKASFHFSVIIAGKEIYDTTVTVLVVPEIAIEPPSHVELSAISRKLPSEHSVVTIQWKDNSDNETHFIIERKNEDETDFSKLIQLPADDTVYLDSANVVPGKTYSYRIQAVNNTDSSLFTLPVSIMAPLFPPEGNDSSFDPSYKGLVGYWSFDESSGNFAGDSAQFHDNGNLGDNISRITGKNNNALDFSNMTYNGYGVTIPDAPQLFLDTSSFTISFWMKADSSAMPPEDISAYLLCKGSIGTNPEIGSTGKRFDLEVKNGELSFALDAGDAGDHTGKDNLETDATPLYSGKWVNLIAVRDMQNMKMKIYIDGKLVADKNIKKSQYGIGEHSALIIGNIGQKELVSGTFTPAPYKGKIDELKIFNYAAPPSKIIELSGFVPKGLVGSWSFDEQTGTMVATDSSIYNDPGGLGAKTIRVQGHKNNAVSFENMEESGYGVKIPDAPQLFLDTSSFSISFWMKADPSLMPPHDISEYIFCKGSIGTDSEIGSTGKRFDLEVKNGELSFALDAGDAGEHTGKDNLETDATPLYTGEWVNVIAIRNTNTQKMEVYINGKLVEDKGISKSKYGIGEHSSLIIGNIGERELFNNGFTPAPFRGDIDELKIFNYPLSLAEILTLYAGGAYAQKPFSPSYNNTVVDGYTDTLKLTWDGGVNTTKYQLYMGADSTNMKLVDDSINVDNPIYKLINVPVHTSYYWRVDAVGILGTTRGDTWHFKTGTRKGLVGYWSFDRNDSGDLVVDSTDYHDDGTLGTNIIKAPGHSNEALSLGGMDDNGFGVKIPDAAQLYLDKSSFSISFWMKADPDILQKDVYLLCKGSIGTDPSIGTTGKRFNLEQKNGTLYFALDGGDAGSGTGKDQISTDATAIATGEWVNVVAIRDMKNMKMKIYISGKLVEEGDIKKSKYGIGEHYPLIVGNIGEPELSSGTFTPAPYKGQIDELKIFNYPLSDALIQKINDDVPFMEKASNPSPADSSIGAGPEKVSFSWTERSGTALAYDFFFGTSPDSLKLIKKGLTSPVFEMDSLTPSATYYWKIKDSSDAQQILGDTWTFTTGKDTIPPAVVLKDSISAKLNADGFVMIKPEDVDSNSHDVYGIDTLILNIDSFNCKDLGQNRVVLTVKDNNGNVATDTASVFVLGTKPEKPTIDPSNAVICSGDWVRLASNQDSSTDRYLWYYNGDEYDKSDVINASQPGQYSVIAVSAQSCRSDTSDASVVNISSDTSLSVSNDIAITRGTSTTLKASGSEGNITWYPNIGINKAEGEVIEAHPTSTTRYTATLTTSLGCKVERSVLVTVNDSFNGKYNKILSPNGDGINDRLIIQNIAGYPDNRINIFDSNGKLVFQKNGYANEWKGRSKGRTLATGTYYFVFWVKGKIKVKGSVTIVH